MEVRVKRAGLQTTVQDLGRAGFRPDGVPLGGAMDRFAARMANLLVGNVESAPLLEFTLRGPELEFSRDTLVAMTGGDFGVLPRWVPVYLSAGTTLPFGMARTGCRGYLAIAGGVDVPLVLGSASTYVRGGFGGGYGRALRDGDQVGVRDAARHVSGHWRVDPRLLPAYSSKPTLRVIRGAHASEFGREFFDAPFQLTSHSDRMGLRLRGEKVARNSGGELRSMPVAPGTVQVPPDGQPIILMADAQTLGGYPQIAHVIAVDLPLAAQLQPGDTVDFLEVSREDAHELALAQEHALAMLRHGLAQKLA